MSFHHLKRYPKEVETEATFGVSAKTGREIVWFYLKKIHALKDQKIVWPDTFGDDVWALTVDGTHFWIKEPQHPEFSYNPQTFSHKFAKAGLNYEIGISLTDNHVIWMNGPYDGGQNDARVFKDYGLKDKLEEADVKGIGDLGYVGFERLSVPNSHDSQVVKKFKSRALKRHKKFNGLIKEFECMSGRFRHSLTKFQVYFETTCVICQYQIEIDRPLFDILVHGLLHPYDEEEE